MILQQPQANTPDDRATEFKAVENTGERFSGTTLVVEAYAAIWLILMAWIFLLWRKQQSLTSRLDGLEAAIDRAASAKDKKKS
jgi:CcmD family protein